jgi:hypothetical protein
MLKKETPASSRSNSVTKPYVEQTVDASETAETELAATETAAAEPSVTEPSVIEPANSDLEQVDWTALVDMEDELDAGMSELHESSESSQDVSKDSFPFSVDTDSDEMDFEIEDVDSKKWSVSEFKPEEKTAPTNKKTAPANVLTYYLYGIVSTESAQKAAFAGIEGLQAGSKVECLKCGSLTAIISEFSDPAYSPYFIRNSMRDNEWLKGQVRHHAGVLSEANGLMTIVPLRFGTVFSSENGIQRFVEGQRGKLTQTLNRLQDKSEFGIRVISDSSESSSNSSDPGLSESNWTKNVCDLIHGTLSKLASEAVENTLVPQIYSETSRVILNATYLVPVVGEKNFRSSITDIAKQLLSEGIRIEVSGPWPPYHFVDVDLGGANEIMMSDIPV